MKYVYAFLISIYFLSCTVNNSGTSFLPLEYRFPEIKTGEKKTYVYVDKSNGDSSFYDYYHPIKNGQVYFIVKTYNARGISDSSVYLNGKLLESYAHLFDNEILTKGVILQDTVIKNGKRLGKHILETRFSSGSLVNFFRAEYEFVKDTVFTWQNTILPTLVIKSAMSLTIKSNVTSNVQSEHRISFVSYQAKGIGTIRITFLQTAENKSKTIDLLQIIDRPNY